MTGERLTERANALGEFPPFLFPKDADAQHQESSKSGSDGDRWQTLGPSLPSSLLPPLLARPFDVTLARLAALSVLVTNQMLMQRGPQNVYPFSMCLVIFQGASNSQERIRHWSCGYPFSWRTHSENSRVYHARG